MKKLIALCILLVMAGCTNSIEDLKKCKDRGGVYVQYILKAPFTYDFSDSYMYLCMPKGLSTGQLAIPYSGYYESYKTTIKILSE